jgi:hypothetical protein
MNHYIEIWHRAYRRRTGAYDACLSEPPNKQALELLKILDLRSGSDRSRPLSIRLETGTKMRSPMRHALHPLGKSARYTSMECAHINT